MKAFSIIIIGVFFLTIVGQTFSFTWTHKSPIVFAGECDRLKTQLAETCHGNRFLLMTNLSTGSHNVKTPTEIRDNLRFMMQASLLTSYSLSTPVIQLDTTFTQYLADKDYLMAGGHDDIVQALNLVRAFIQGGIGDISHYQDWVMVNNRLYDKTLFNIGKSVDFINTLGLRSPIKIDNYYVGHTCGFLPYEEQMTRNDSISGRTYACSSHFLWAENLSNLHHLCGVENPIGIVVTGDTLLEEMTSAIEKLNPHNIPGKTTLIVRMHPIHEKLPKLIDRVQEKQYNVVWCCDPVGNDRKTNLYHFLQIHSKKKTVAGGVFVREKSVETLNLIHSIHKTKTKPKNRGDVWNRFSM